MSTLTQRPDGQALTGPTRTQPLVRLWRARERQLLAVATPIVLVVLWQLSFEYRWLDRRYTSSPTAVWDAAFTYFRSGNAGKDLRVSASEFGWGYGLSLVFGVPLGALLGWYRRLQYAFDPLIAFLYATPRVALVPMFVIWFGVGISSKVALVVALAIFPLIINTAAAIRTIDPDLIRVAHVYGASTSQMFRTIVLPGTLPHVISGARLALGLALIGVVVGELAVSNAGIGYRMVQSATFFRTDQVLVSVLIVSLTGAVLSGLFQRLERRLSRWREVR